MKVMALTPHQQGILAWLAWGLTRKQLAYECGKSPKTIDDALRRIKKNLGIHSFARLVHFAIATGLVPMAKGLDMSSLLPTVPAITRAVPAPLVAPGVSLVASWTFPTNETISGFRIYCGAVPGGYTNAVSVPAPNRSASIGNLVAGVRYYMAVSAVGTNGIESDFSSEANAVAGQQQYRIDIENAAVLAGPWSNACAWTNIVWTTNAASVPTNQFWRLRIYRIQ